ncbi:MAG: chitobiase/beta-hexosaminidase C-terminal domain-containing protein [Armatimonadetes bacterium]|nr:chitobiase/beta-hexosaminidase C-terminal domain-containing protein [Armatimonadota bacterium]
MSGRFIVVLVAASIAMLVSMVPAQALGAWDLATDWSDESNPAGDWTYGWIDPAGAWTTFPDHIPVWQWAGQPAWGGNGYAYGVPAMAKSTGVAPGAFDVPAGRVFGHTPTMTGTNDGWFLAARWTAPSDMSIDISGGVWVAYRDSLPREENVSLFINGVAVVNDVLIPVDANSGSPYAVGVQGVAIQGGQTVMLAARHVAGNYGTHVGMDLTITEVPPSETVLTPIFNPDGGAYFETQPVTITCLTQGAEIRYTTDGSDPTTGTIYSVPVLVDRPLTLKAQAFKNGMLPSAVKIADYVIQVATPTFSPDGSGYASEQPVTISCATPSAAIYYTTDGSEPDDITGTPYSNAITISQTSTLKARAYKSPLNPSFIKRADYTIGSWDLALNWSDASNPGGAWAYGWMEEVSRVWSQFTNYISSWQTDGQPAWVYNNLSGIPGICRIVAGIGGWDIPAGRVGGHTPNQGLFGGTDRNYLAVRWTAPTDLSVDLSGGVWRAYDDEYQGTGIWRDQLVALLVNGAPLINDVLVPRIDEGVNSGSPFTLAQAIAAGGGNASNLLNIPLSQGQTIELGLRVSNDTYIGTSVGIDFAVTAIPGTAKTAMPDFSPDGGNFAGPQTVTITCGTPGANIYYTTNGTEPSDTTGMLYNGTPVAISQDLTLKAKAYKTGLLPSQVKSASYSLVVTSWNLAADWSDTSNPAGAWAYGWMDSSLVWTTFPNHIPDWMWAGLPAWNGPYPWGVPGMAKSTGAGPGDWPVGRVFGHTPTGGGTGEGGFLGARWTAPSDMSINISGGVWIALSDALPRDQKVSLFINGVPVVNDVPIPAAANSGSPYAVGAQDVAIQEGQTVILAARHVDGNYGTHVGMDLTIDAVPGTISAAMPSFTPGDGVYLGGQSVTMTCATYGARIYYTTDGTDPTEASTLYTGTPVSVASPVTLKARAYRDTLLPSRVTSAVYTFTMDKSISEVKKTIADGTTVGCGSVVVTAELAGGMYYVEEPDRSFGIQCRAASGFPVGTLVDAAGTVQTDQATGERYIAGATLTKLSDTLVDILPLAMNGRAVGGGAYGLQAGIAGASGLNNIGLLVKVWGRVVSAQADRFSISDGSSTIAVVVPDGVELPAIDSYVSVAGISSCEKPTGVMTQLIRVRGSGDITELQAPPAP